VEFFFLLGGFSFFLQKERKAALKKLISKRKKCRLVKKI